MTKLDKGTVIAAALELLNEVGMDDIMGTATIIPSFHLPANAAYAAQ